MSEPPPDHIVRFLGSGNAGEVFEAVIDGSKCALKLVSVPPPSSHDRWTATHSSPQFTSEAKFNAELAAYQTMAPIDGLRGRVCSLHSTCTNVHQLLRGADPALYQHKTYDYHRRGLCLTLLDGATLDDDDGSGSGSGSGAVATLSQQEKHDVGAQLAETVRLLHEAGVTHGSVHPRNVMLVRSGGGRLAAVLIDFNRARLREGRSAESFEGHKAHDLSEVLWLRNNQLAWTI